jgi:sensor histidine kinase YesM
MWTLVFAAVVYAAWPHWLAAFLREGAIWQFVWGLVLYGGLIQVARAHVRAKQRELAAANAELAALRAQLNPHFLFNTLHSLSQLACEDPPATRDALERFGDLMRYVLQAGRIAPGDVSLEAELDFARSYLAIERLRLGDRLRVVEDIDADALELAVPPLLLQPLLENAVRHGLAPRREGGTIRLNVRLSETLLAIEISDDGRGCEADAWRHAKGLGLEAVARQLDARFAGAASLRVTTAPRQGFTAHLEMPVCVAGRAHA